MAKLTYLELVNRVLKRVTLPEVATVVGSSGHTKIVSELINEAQNELWTEANNWHSLYTMRTFYTVAYTASTIAFVDSSPDTITDTANGFGSFKDGQTIVVSGSASNDGVYVIYTAAAGTLTLQTSDTLTAEALGDSITIYAVTYPLASDFGRSHSLVDMSNNRILTEDFNRVFDENDPDMSQVNNPTHFSIQGNFYRIHYIPGASYKMVDRYWKFPTPLSTNAQTSDLPLFCENFLIQWALMGLCEYMHKFEDADRIKAKIYDAKSGLIFKSKSANSKIIDQMFRFQDSASYNGLQPPKFPSNYGVY